MQQQKKHTRPKLHTCDACDKALDFTHSLLDIKEFTLERNMFSVMNVGRPLANRQAWNDAAELILQENNTFDNVSTLIELWKTYTEPIVYKFGEKCFQLYSQFSKHQRTHIEEKSFKYDLCGKDFSQENVLKQH